MPAAAVPSTNAFVASPQPTASTTDAADDPQRERATGRGEPAACRPRRRSPPNEPAPLTTRNRLPGVRMVDAAHVALRVTVEPDDVA